MNRKLLVALLLTVLVLSLGSFESAPVDGSGAIVLGGRDGHLGSTNGMITLTLIDIAFVPTEITINGLDEPVTIELENTGDALHNFSIDSLKINVDVSPGITLDVVIPAGTAAGTYDFYCNIPGHKEAGMVGKLTIEGPIAHEESTTTPRADDAATPGSVLEGGVVPGQNSTMHLPMFRGNPARTGEAPGPGPDPEKGIVELWSFQAGDSVSSVPAVIDGVVYVGSIDNVFYAVDAETGQQLWSYSTGDSIYSSPAVVDGIVYFGSQDGSLYALEARTGLVRWSFQAQDGIGTSPLVVDGVVYVGSDDHFLYAIAADSGKPIWEFDAGDTVYSSPAISSGIVYVANFNGVLHAVDALTGKRRWSFQGVEGMSATPAVVDGTVYIGDRDRSLFALDAYTGSERWTFEMGRGDGSGPAVSDGVVYVASWDDSLYAIDAATGEELWSLETGDEISGSPTIADGVVYVGSHDSFVYAVDAATGNLEWYWGTSNSISTSPVVAGSAVYIGNAGGYLYALGNPTPELQTATAVTGITATAQAAEAATTATAIANLTATAEAVEQSWQNYFWPDIHDAFSTRVGELPGMSLDDSSPALMGKSYVPDGYFRMAQFPVSIAGGSASAQVMLAIFPSKEDADAAMEDVSGGLIRSGWEVQDVEGIDHNHVCLTVQYSMGSEALCYVTRDDALILSNSTVSLPKPEVALLNAADLARIMSDVYDEIDRPE